LKNESISFNSIQDIQDIDITEELKGEDLGLNKLLELLDLISKKYEFFVILKRISKFICNKDYTIEKLQVFKEKLIQIFENLIDFKEFHDIVVIPFLFEIFRNIFFKTKSSEKINKLKKKWIQKDNEIKYKEVITYIKLARYTINNTDI
jgi:hypothetical protein